MGLNIKAEGGKIVEYTKFIIKELDDLLNLIENTELFGSLLNYLFSYYEKNVKNKEDVQGIAESTIKEKTTNKNKNTLEIEELLAILLLFY